MGREQVRELAQHRLVSLAGLGNVGRRQQPPAQAVEVEALLVVLLDELHLVGREEALQRGVAGEILVRDLVVVDGMAAHEVFVGAQKRRGVNVAVVPDENSPAARLQNARELGARLVGSKPVEGLSGHDEVNTRVGQSRGFGAAVHHAEVGVGGEIVFAGAAHLAIGLDADHAIAVVEKDLGQQPRAAADIGDEVLGPQTAGFLQSVHDFG